ncbi:hypothetical protein EC973_004572 [Apophysomyces ossiformis]|uniref:Uncharacterized protein n=1 Tax=Apophysomyces ossiformis TaxID=679940 RepID=A0A8H7ERA5_9FUNG|nr:hypothetical protein EC973_004572 [Apophysomyces ossiformis]
MADRPGYIGGYPGNYGNIYDDTYRMQDMDLNLFLMDRNVRLYWVAFLSLWVYWGLFWFLRHVFGDGHMEYAARSEGTGTAAAEAPPTTGLRAWIRRPSVARTHSRLNRASEILRDLVLMLLSVLILNTLARGGTRAVMILAWIFFGFAIFWSIFEASYEHHIARFVYAVIFYGIALAIAGISFRHGFHNIYY